MKDIHDIIKHAKFGDDRLRGSGVVAGQISAFPIDFVGRPYNTLTLPCERVMSPLAGEYAYNTDCIPFFVVREIEDAFLPARRYAGAVLAVTLCLSVSVHHKSIFCGSGRTDRAGFWHGCFIRPIPHCVIKIIYSQKTLLSSVTLP